MTVDNKVLLEYACEKFQEQKYDEALEIFVLLYMRNYEQDWILEMIYSCYMSGNLQEFQNAFERNADAEDLAYEDCALDFIPYQEGKYYIYDKELAVFRGTFSFNNLTEVDSDAVFDNLEFSAVVLELDWNWNEEMSVLASAKDRNIYVVAHDLKRCVSFFKIPELTEYMRNVKIFPDISEFQEYFHRNTAVYLPKRWKASGLAHQFEDIIRQEHLYRLTPEGRNTENVLLTIGIPTHDRGNLLIERMKNLRRVLYDAEIEFAVSKNGTHFYQEEYRQVEEMTDARINYVGYDCEVTMSKNWQNVIKIAHGKFVLLVSDEDDVIVQVLEHYLKLLSGHEDLAYVRSNTSVQYNTILRKSQYLKKGRDAFFGGFLKQNYLSGAIYNRHTYLEADIDRWNERYEFNSFYRLYPHVWWQAVLAFDGDYAEDEVCLIQEGDCVLFEEIAKYRSAGVEEKELMHEGMDEETSLAYVSTYAGRIEQFEGVVLLIKDFEKLDEESKALALTRLIEKTLYLMEMVRIDYHYKIDEFPMWVEKMVERVAWAIDELSLGPEFERTIWINTLNFVKIVDEETKDES